MSALSGHANHLLTAVGRGAALGLLPLLLWGAAGPFLARFVGPAGGPMLLVGVVACYVLAGLRAGRELVGIGHLPLVGGAFAALATYLLVVPLSVMAGQAPPLEELATSSVLALAVGALAGRIAITTQDGSR